MPKQLNNELPNRVIVELIKIRKAQRLMQEDMYFDTGIHIGRIEAGNFDITLSTLKKLTNYYSTDLATLFKKIKE